MDIERIDNKKPKIRWGDVYGLAQPAALMVRVHKPFQKVSLDPSLRPLEPAPVLAATNGAAAAAAIKDTAVSPSPTAFQWLSPVEPEELNREYKSLFQCSIRCPAKTDYKLLQYLAPFVSACFNSDLNGVITFGVMEKKELPKLQRQYEAIVGTNLAWPLAAGFRCAPWLTFDEHVRQCVLDRDLLGIAPGIKAEDQALWIEILDPDTQTFSTASTAADNAQLVRKWVSSRVRAVVKPLEGQPKGDPGRWILQVQVFGATSASNVVDPVQFICRARPPILNFESHELSLQDVLVDAVVKEIEDQAVDADADQISVVWVELFEKVCGQFWMLPMNSDDSNSTVGDTVKVEFGQAGPVTCGVDNNGRIIDAPKKYHKLLERCKNIAKRLHTHARQYLKQDEKVKLLRAAHRRAKEESGVESSDFLKTAEALKALELKLLSCIYNFADHLRNRVQSHGQPPSTWVWRRYHKMAPVDEAAMYVRNHHGTPQNDRVDDVEARRKVVKTHVESYTNEKHRAKASRAVALEKKLAKTEKRAIKKVLGVGSATLSGGSGSLETATLDSSECARRDHASAAGAALGTRIQIEKGLFSQNVEYSGSLQQQSSFHRKITAGSTIDGLLTYTVCAKNDEEPLLAHVTNSRNSQVYKAYYSTKSPEPAGYVALKRATRGSDLLREASAYFSIDPDRTGTGVALLRDIARHGDDMFLVVDWADKGTLKDWVSSAVAKCSPKTAPLFRRRGIEYAIQAARGINALHKLPTPMVHQDIKPANLLLFASDIVQVADLGLVQKDGGEEVVGGTRTYMAPEQLVWLTARRHTAAQLHSDVDQPGPPCDVWALGLVIAEVLCIPNVTAALEEYQAWMLQAPSRIDMTSAKQIAMQMPERAALVADSLRSSDADLATLLHGCFARDPNKRPLAIAVRRNLEAWYKNASGADFNLPTSHRQLLSQDLFRVFPTTRERQAWYASNVAGDHLRARVLLNEYADVVIRDKLKRCTTTGIQTLITDPKLMTTIPELLPSAMEWIEAFCNADDENDSELRSTIRLASLLQNFWFDDQKLHGVLRSSCCSRRFGSARDFDSPMIRICSVGTRTSTLVVKDLLRNVKSPKRYASHVCYGGRTPLSAAIQHDNPELVIALVAAEADVNSGASNGDTPLHLASQSGHVAVVRSLIEAKADVNKGRSDNGGTPLHVAAQYCQVDVTELLIEAEADVNRGASMGETPLHVASQRGHVAVMRSLIEAKADVDKEADFGVTPLYVAAEFGQMDVVEVLIAAQADVSKRRTDCNASPFQIAVYKRHGSVVNALLDARGKA